MVQRVVSKVHLEDVDIVGVGIAALAAAAFTAHALLVPADVVGVGKAPAGEDVVAAGLSIKDFEHLVKTGAATRNVLIPAAVDIKVCHGSGDKCRANNNEKAG